MQKRLQKPRVLRSGDTLAAVTLSWGGPSVHPHRYLAGKRQLEEAYNIKVVEMPHTLSDANWLQKNPQARADDLMQAFSDPSINGIISTIGGEDSIRLMPYIDYDVIYDNPKVFMGFSDTTISHFMCVKAGVGSFYGPAIMAGFGENGGLLPYMQDSVQRCLFSSEPIGEVKPNMDGWTVEHLDWGHPELQTQKRKLNQADGWSFIQGSGRHKGYLIGGCLEVLDWLRGSALWPQKDVWKDAILFLETSEEGIPPVAVARILRTFAAAGILKEARGVLFGRPGGQMSPDSFEEYNQVILQIIADEQDLHDLPIVTGMDFGHTDPIMVLPYGALCEIDCDGRRIFLPENAVV